MTIVRTWGIRGRVAVLAVAVLGTGAACGDPLAADGDTNIRLRNASTFELTTVTFSPGPAELEFARISPGATTGYVPVIDAYRYGYLDLQVDGVRRTLVPVDYVGENYIGAGRFTYVITIDPTTRNPSVSLVED
jgi:hypothetical protein